MLPSHSIQYNWFLCTGQIKTQCCDATGWQAGCETGLCTHGTAEAFIRTAHIPFPLVWRRSSPRANIVFNRSAGLSLQNVTAHPLPECWEMQVFHHAQVLEAAAGGKRFRFCWCRWHQSSLIINNEKWIDFFLLHAFSKLGPCQS